MFRIFLVICCALLMQVNAAFADAEFVYIPDVTGKPLYGEGSKILFDALKPLNCSMMPNKYESITDPALDGIILRTEPAGGSKVLRCGSVTTITGKTGKLFPDVIGMQKDAAIAEIKKTGLKNNIKVSQNYYSGKPAGEVYAQSPIASTPISSIPANMDITLSIVIGVECKIPNTIDYTESAAVSLLNNYIKSCGLNNTVKVQYDYACPTAPLDNKVYKQTPSGGTDLSKTNENIVLTVFKYEKLKIPDVINKSQTDAVNTLKNNGFTNIKIVYQNTKNRSENYVDSVSPAAGSAVTSLSTPIQLMVAKNDKKYMPNFAGMTEQQVRNKLNELGVPSNKIWIDTYPFSKTMPNGIVHHQSPNPGDEIDGIINSVGQLIGVGINKLDAIPLPMVTGLTYEEAKKKLNDAGFTSVHDYYQLYTDKDLAERPYLIKTNIGKVVRTDPSQGSHTPNTYIAVYIGKSETPIAGISEVEVPSIGQLKEDSAIIRLKNLGLIPKVTYNDTFDTFLPGTASSITVPKAGTKVKAGTEVKITVYKYKPKVPFLKGYTVQEAKDKLTALSLKYELDYKSTTVKTLDARIAEYSPKAQTQVEPGSIVKITVYKYDQVRVPNLIGLSEEKAINYLKEYKSDINYKIVYENTVYKTEAGKVYKTSPEKEALIKPGDNLTVYVKKMLASVPNLIGKTEANALNILKKEGFKVRTRYVESKEVGKVLEQTQKAGKPVQSPVITLIIGKKPADIKLPSVVGKTKEEAISIIKSTASLSYKVQEKNVFTSSQTGTVVHMYPAGNTMAPPDSQINLYIGKYVGNVPNVVGLSENEAKNKLSQAGFAGIVLYTSEGTPGKVVNQKPDANADPNPPPNGNFVNIYVAKSSDATKQEYNPWQRDYIMPYVTGLSVMEARMMLAANKINYVIREHFTENEKAGKIQGTEPGPGKTVYPNRTAVLHVGMSYYAIPNLLGMSSGRAISIIKHSRMDPVVKKLPTLSQATSGPPVVVSQTPAPGSPKQGKYIYITIAYDQRVPELYNKQMYEAIIKLQEMGLRYNIEFVEVEEGYKAGKVLYMSPNPGQSIKNGSPIELKIGKLPDEVPDVIGKSEKEADAILKNLKFYPEKEYISSSRSNNIVIAQGQQPGAKRGASNIKIILGTQEALASIDEPTPIIKVAPNLKAAPAAMAAPETKLSAGAPPPESYAPASNEETAKIKELYTSLKQAYEYKDEHQITNLLSNNWESADGSNVIDVEDNLRNKFSLYDDIQCNISNLSINKAGNVYKTAYEIEITGKIYGSGITRKEKSSVSEEIIMENGKTKINKTLSGRFWYRE